MKLGILPLGRPTFDVPYAEARLAAMLARTRRDRARDRGAARTLLFDAEATRAAIAGLGRRRASTSILLLQVTFTDASMTVEPSRRAFGRAAGDLGGARAADSAGGCGSTPFAGSTSPRTRSG